MTSLPPPQLVQPAAEALNQAISRAASASIPFTVPRTRTKPPWWSKDLDSFRTRLKAAARCRYDGGCLAADYRLARNKYTAELRRSKNASWRTFCSNGSSWWDRRYKWAKKGSRPVPIPSAFKKPDGSFTASMDESASFLLHALIPNDLGDRVFAPPSPNDRHLFDPVDLSELKAALFRQSPSKAPGLDGITGGIVRRAWPVIAHYFLALANSCLQSGIFPDIWKMAIVVPIPKGPNRDPTECNSYRPISLLPVLGKIVERLIGVGSTGVSSPDSRAGNLGEPRVGPP